MVDTASSDSRMEIFATLGSLRLTLWLIVLLALTIGLSYLLPTVSNIWLALPLLMLVLNLLGAILSNSKFRQQIPLLAFHLALLLLLLLIAAGQLSRLKGHVEVTEGEQFSGELTAFQAGPLHHGQLGQVKFLLESFTINYAPGRQRGETRSYIRWIDEEGRVSRGVVGDHRPFIMGGYRFYTSHNKGFAPIFTWYPAEGKSVTGSIHLPAYPAHEYEQALEWSPTGSELKIWTQLQFDEVILDPTSPSQFHAPLEHILVIRIGEGRYELKPGESIELPEGRLVYDELRTWMGFTVSSDWTLPWLFAAGLFVVLSMGWHYWSKFNSRPWQDR